MISVRDLRIDYDDVCAVDGLSMEIEQGEIYGLIGPNGAGKTSTMRAMVGLLEPTYGEIQIAGVDVRESTKDAGRVVGFMPDFPPLYEDLLVWEFLDLFAASYFIPRDRRHDDIDHYLGLVGLEEKRDRLVSELSRGMRQRLMLAKTLLPQPQVLLLDEPASGMDPNGRIELKNTVRKLAHEGRTVLISSHILTELSEFCTSVGIMEKGRMVVSGRIDEISAQLRGTEVLVVEVLKGAEQFRQVIEQDPHCGEITTQNSIFEFPYQSGKEEASQLLATLVESGVRIVSFSHKRENLEDVFLQVGARELS